MNDLSFLTSAPANKLDGALGATLDFGTANDAPQREPDEVIWKRASSAANGQKFRNLCEANWRHCGYRDIDAAVLGLLSFLAFYSPNNEQCVRMFRQTHLSQRPKLDFLSQQWGPMKEYWINQSMRRARDVENARAAEITGAVRGSVEAIVEAFAKDQAAKEAVKQAKLDALARCRNWRHE